MPCPTKVTEWKQLGTRITDLVKETLDKEIRGASGFRDDQTVRSGELSSALSLQRNATYDSSRSAASNEIPQTSIATTQTLQRPYDVHGGFQQQNLGVNILHGYYMGHAPYDAGSGNITAAGSHLVTISSTADVYATNTGSGPASTQSGSIYMPHIS